MPFAPRIAEKVPSLVLIVLLVDFGAAAGATGAAAAEAATGATGALAVGAAGAAAGLVEGVTSLLCDQAPLVGSAMSPDNNKIRQIFMAKSLDNID